MIPSLNLQKLKCTPAPVLSPSASATTPRGPTVASQFVRHGSDAPSNGCPSSSDSRFHMQHSASGGGGHEASAIRSGGIPASEFLGVDVDAISDVAVLRKKLHDAKGLLVALDAWYAARLAEKEQLMVHRLAQLTQALDSGATCKPRTPTRHYATPPSRGVSPRVCHSTPIDRRRAGGSPSVSRAASEMPGSDVNGSVHSGRRTSGAGGTRSPPAGAVVHPRPFNSNPTRRGSGLTTSALGAPYIPPTVGYSPRAPLSGSSGAGRVPSTPGTPMSTPRVLSSRVAGHSPIENAHGGWMPSTSPRQYQPSSGVPLSARSAGGATCSSVRKSQAHVVNWSSTIPHSDGGGGGVVRGSTPVGNGVAARGAPAAQHTNVYQLGNERRAYTPRY